MSVLTPVRAALLRAQPDDRLVGLIREGSEPAFAELVRRTRPELVLLAAAYAPAADVEDAVQESLIRAWRALRSSDGEINVRPWLKTIVRNRALSARAGTRYTEELDERIDGVRQPADIVLTNDQLERAVGAIKALPDSQRDAFARHVLSGEGHEEIANAMGVSRGSARQLIFRARTTVRQAAGAAVPYPLLRFLLEPGAVTPALLGSKSVAVAAIAVAGAGVGIERTADLNLAAPPAAAAVHQQRSTPALTATADSATGQRSASADDAAEPARVESRDRPAAEADPVVKATPADPVAAAVSPINRSAASEAGRAAQQPTSSPPQQQPPGEHRSPDEHQPPPDSDQSFDGQPQPRGGGRTPPDEQHDAGGDGFAHGGGDEPGGEGGQAPGGPPQHHH